MRKTNQVLQLVCICGYKKAVHVEAVESVCPECGENLSIQKEGVTNEKEDIAL